jgi:hypothetical protein
MFICLRLNFETPAAFQNQCEILRVRISVPSLRAAGLYGVMQSSLVPICNVQTNMSFLARRPNMQNACNSLQIRRFDKSVVNAGKVASLQLLKKPEDGFENHAGPRKMAGVNRPAFFFAP